MRFTTSVSLLALVLGATAAPFELQVGPQDTCAADNRNLVFFNVWTTECNAGSGRTMGMKFVIPSWTNLCFPLPDDTHALEIIEIAPGCRRK